MIRRAPRSPFTGKTLPVALATLLLAACATQPRPQPGAVVLAPPEAAGPTLPPVPQPEERPVAPVSVTDPAIAQPQREAAFF